MIEDLLNNQENSNSILIVDSFDKNAKALLYLFIQKLIERENVLVNLYPSENRSLKSLAKFKKAHLRRVLVENLFIAKSDDNTSIFDMVARDLDSSSSEDLKKCLVFDNINLIIRHLNGNPFRLLQFLIDLRTKNQYVLMVVHEDSIDSAVVNQLRMAVQTVVRVADVSLKQHEFAPPSNKRLFIYDLVVDNRSYRNFKVVTHNETLYMSDDGLELVKVEKHVRKSGGALDKKSETAAGKEEDPLKGLTFNVHLSSDDLEAKRNLVLPYEIVGKTKQPEQKPRTEQESKIFYAPDERDDVDDDDPDDDLNF